MTTVKYDRPGLCMEIRGHAGAAPAGEDLVCAAASMLAWTLVDVVSETAEYYAHVEIREDGASITARASPDYELEDICYAVYDTIGTGFEILAEKYPEYVSYEMIGGKDDGEV